MMHTRAAALVAAIAVGGMAWSAQAASYIEELPGNIFHSTTSPGPVYVQNNQDQGGGSDAGGTGTWPIFGNSYMTDGDLETHWNGGTGQHMNLSFTAASASWDGKWEAPGPQLTPTPGGFGEINMIRIYAPTNLNGWKTDPAPRQVRINYTMSNENRWMGEGFNAAVYLIGDLRDPDNVRGDGNPTNGGYQYPAQIWPEHAVIAAVNGVPVTPDADGFVSLDGAFSLGGYQASNGNYVQYTDLMVHIPEGSFSIAFEFGATTPDAGRLWITDIQASVVPEPTSMALLGVTLSSLLGWRRRR